MKVYIKNDKLVLGKYEIPAGASYVYEYDDYIGETPTSFRLLSSGSNAPLPMFISSFVKITDCENELGVPYTNYSDFTSAVGSFFANASAVVSAKTVGAYGFVVNAEGKTDRSTSLISWDNVTYTLTLTPVVAFSYAYASIQKTSTVALSDQIDNTIEGKWYFYIDETNILVTTHVFSDELILKQVLVASIYWDAVNQTIVGDPFDERHGHLQDGETHLQLHKALRTRYDSGLSINTFTIGDGSLDAHVKFIVGAGKIHDEDLDHNISESTSTIPILYSLGSPTTIRTITNASFAVTTTGTGRLAYNKASDNSLAEVTDGYFVAYHIFGMPGIDEESGQLFSIMGQNEYATLELAIEGAKSEISLIRVSYLLSSEMKDLGSIILQTNDTYINAVKAKVVDTATGVHYLDWRFDAAIPSNLPQGDHDSLNPKLAAGGVQFGHVNDLAQTFDGPKEFTGDVTVKTLQLEPLTVLPALAKGQLAWNAVKETISVGTEVAGSTIEIGEVDIYGYNLTGLDLADVRVVYITDSVEVGGLTYKVFDEAIADTEDHAFKSLAVTTNPIVNGQKGRATVHGDVGNYDTSSYIAGQILYLSPTVKGDLTPTKPQWPHGVVQICQVGKVHATEGTIYISIDKIVDIQATIDSNSLVPNTRTINGHALTGDVVVTKTDLSIENVDNTSDADKPISDAVTIALSGKISTYASKTAKYFLAAPNAVNGLPDFRAIVASDIPTLNQSTSGTASNVSGTPALPNGVTATKQATGDNTDKLATDSFVQMERALDVQLAGIQNITGDKTFSGKVERTGAQVNSGVISPTTLSANANDYNPTGFATCNAVRQDATANRNVTGFAAQLNGFEFILFNISGSSLTIQNDNAGSTAANRVLTPNATNLVIRTQGSAVLWYDGTSARWRIKGNI